MMYHQQMRQLGPNNVSRQRCDVRFSQKRCMNEGIYGYQPQAKTAVFCNETSQWNDKYPGQWMTKQHQKNIICNNGNQGNRAFTQFSNENNRTCFQAHMPRFPPPPNDFYLRGSSGGSTFNSQFPQPWGYQTEPILQPPWPPHPYNQGFKRKPPLSHNSQISGSTNQGTISQPTVPMKTPSSDKSGNTSHQKSCEQVNLDDTDQRAKEEAIKKVVKENKVFVAANVHGIIRWAQLKPQVLPIFELIGRLDSQVTKFGEYSKSFVMKDGQNQSIDCVFYETDRKLPALYRGRMFRCVGEFNTKKKHFLCVSVRETSPEETQSYRKLLATCNKTLKQRMEKLNTSDHKNPLVIKAST